MYEPFIDEVLDELELDEFESEFSATTMTLIVMPTNSLHEAFAVGEGIAGYLSRTRFPSVTEILPMVKSPGLIPAGNDEHWVSYIKV